LSLFINPDLGDTFEVSQQGSNWRFGYWYKQDAQPKAWHLANFPSDFNVFNVADGSLESVLLELALAAGRAKGLHD
jgi:hypothetical protein